MANCKSGCDSSCKKTLNAKCIIYTECDNTCIISANCGSVPKVQDFVNTLCEELKVLKRKLECIKFSIGGFPPACEINVTNINITI
jgi:hypothetical protein